MESRKQKNGELKKHVSTIHCSNTLSLLQRKIANALLYHAYDDLLKKDEYQISIRALCALIGYESHDYKTIKKALIDLLSTVIEWNIIAEDSPSSEEQWNASSIIADASIKGAVCTYSYSNKMKQLLFMPSIYGRLNMVIQAKFKSSYGLALYENAVRYQNLRQTPWFELAIFRKLMGVEAEKYLIFRDFKRRVLDKAIDEVNAYSSIQLFPQFKKEKRQITAIRFDIQPNEPGIAELELDDDRRADSQLVNRIHSSFGLTQKQINKVINKFPPSYIEEKIRLIENSPSFQQGKIINLANYFLTALAEDFQAPKAVKSIGDKTTSAKVDKPSPTVHIQLPGKHEKAYANYLSNIYHSALASITLAEKQTILTNFANHISAKDSDFIKQLYRKSGLKNKFVEMEFRQYLQTNFPEIAPKTQTWEEFVLQRQEGIGE